MIERDNVDEALQRVSMPAFLYYPEVHVDEPSYSLSSDLNFCMEPLAGLGDAEREELRELLGRAIIDPSVYREDVFAALTELTAPEPAEK
jgi:hypothetical protein